MTALRDTSMSVPNPHTQRIIGFFPHAEDSYKAVSDLKAAGFTSDEIGLIRAGELETSDSPVNQKDLKTSGARADRSLWDKIKDFFKGEPGETDYARQILEEHGADLRESGFPAYAGQQTASANIDVPADQRILLHGEILSIQKDRVQRGEVRLRKEVVTENQNVEVPVTREELVIERNPVEGREAEAGSFESGDKEIRVPLTEEKVRVEKKPVVTEEVKVGKRQVQDNRNVSDSVRHEEVRVEKEGDVADEEVGDIDNKKRRIA